jgi:hypothetical protein
MFANMAPGVLKKWLIVAAVVYFLVPFDLLPDFLGLPGRVDDLGVIALLTWFFRNHAKQYALRMAKGAFAGSSAGGMSAATEPGPFDPYRVLGVDHAASGAAIQAAYRTRMKEYHPDKVAHLGEDLQKLAHERSQEIQRAYRELSSSGK